MKRSEMLRCLRSRTTATSRNNEDSKSPELIAKRPCPRTRRPRIPSRQYYNVKQRAANRRRHPGRFGPRRNPNYRYFREALQAPQPQPKGCAETHRRSPSRFAFCKAPCSGGAVFRRVVPGCKAEKISHRTHISLTQMHAQKAAENRV